MSTIAMSTVALPSTVTMSVLGQGTSRMGEGLHPAREEIAELRLASLSA